MKNSYKPSSNTNFEFPQTRRILYYEKSEPPKVVPSQCPLFLPLASSFFPKPSPLNSQTKPRVCCVFSSVFFVLLIKPEAEEVFSDVHRPPFKVLRKKDFLMKKVKKCSEEVLKLLVRLAICIMNDVLRVLRVVMLMIESSRNALSWLQRQLGVMELIWLMDQSTGEIF